MAENPFADMECWFRVKDDPDPRPCDIRLYGDGTGGVTAQAGPGETVLLYDMIVERSTPHAQGAFRVRGEQRYHWDGEQLHDAECPR